ncbi:hypothetical protein C5167_027419 [Papaver somniferum]|nr:hypothetical protein C5167_027419 [Papaver somniferum]
MMNTTIVVFYSSEHKNFVVRPDSSQASLWEHAIKVTMNKPQTKIQEDFSRNSTQFKTPKWLLWGINAGRLPLPMWLLWIYSEATEADPKTWPRRNLDLTYKTIMYLPGFCLRTTIFSREV